MWGKVSIFCLLLIGFVSTENNSKCQIKDVTEKDWAVYLRVDFNDNQINEIIFESEYTGAINGLTCSIASLTFARNYLDFSTNDTHFIVKTTDELKYFDEDILKSKKNGSTGSYKCTMTCQDETASSELEITSTVSDYNNHSPVFSKGSTTYVVSSPIMAKTDFTFFGDKISATDGDFTNQNIAFKTDPDHFEVTSSEDKSTIPSTFTATFRAKKILYISEPVTYTITATDSGTLPGPNSTPLTVTLVLDEENAVKIPAFDSLSYIYQYNSDNSLTALSGPINFQITATDPKFSLSGDLKDHFSVSYDSATSQVSLKLETNIDDPSTPYTILNLSYEGGVDATTSIIIYFTTAPTEENVKFKQTLYTGTYDDTTGKGTVKLDQDIEVEITGSTGEPTVYISEGTDFDAKTYFSLTKVTDHYEVTVEKDLTDEILKQQKSLVITIGADLDTTKTYATLVINLPVQKYLEFDETLYSGSYDTTNEDVKFSVDDIKITTNIPNEVTVSITSDYQEYFQVTYSTSTSSVTISNTEIPEEKLQGVSAITILLTATLNAGSISASSVVNIKIIKDDTEADSLEFDNVLYGGTYEIKDKTATVSFDEIKINTNKPEEVGVSLKTLDKYFSASYDPTNSVVTIKNDAALPEDQLTNTIIPIVLLASFSSGSVSASAVVNLKIINDDTNPDNNTGYVLFDTLSYSAEYSVVDNKGVLQMDNKLTITTDQDNNKIDTSITDDLELYPTYIGSSYSEKEFIVTLVQNLPDTVLSKSFVTLTLTASIKDNPAIKTSAVLTIKINNNNSEKSLKFENALYEGQYEIKDSEGTLTLDSMKIITDSTNDVTVSLDDTYKDYLEATYDSATATAKLTKTANLPDNLLKGKSVISPIITATLKDSTVTAAAAINLKIVNDDIEAESLEFDNVLYGGTYEIIDKTVTVSFDAIKINTNKPDEVGVSLKTLEKYFSVSYDPTNSVVTIKNEAALPEDQLTNTVIPIVLLASFSSGNVSASAVVNLKIINDDTNPDNNTGFVLFDTLSYSAQYSVLDNKGVLQIDNKITVTTDQDNNKIDTSITDDLELYPTYISSSYSDKEFIVTLVENLPDTVLSKSFVTLTLTASIKDNPAIKTSAVLTIKINNNNSEKSLKFENTLYEGQYEIKDSEGTLTLDSMKIITDSTNDVTVSLDDTYKDYLKATYDSATATAKLTKTANLPDNLLKGKSVISPIITATLKDSTITATAVINLKIVNDDVSNDYIEFTSLLYNGKYEIKNKVATVSVDDVTINTDKTSDVEVTINNFYKDYFNVEYTASTSTVAISLFNEVPDDVLLEYSTISIVLSASIKNKDLNAGTVINLRIIYDDVPTPSGSLSFDTFSNTAEYSVVDNKGVLTVEDIGLTTDRQNDEIQTDITDDDGLSATYFKSSYSDQKFTVTLKDDLPEDIFNSKTFISLTLTAGIKNTSLKTNAILTIKIDNDQNPSTGHIAFSSPVYAAVYQIKDDEASIPSIDVISIETDQEDENVVVTIQKDKDSYFNVAYANKIVTMSLKSTTPNKNLRSQGNIPVVLLAHINGATDSDKTTVVNFKVEDYDSGDTADNSTVSFNQLVYEGHCTYELDHKIDLEADKVYLVTDRPESEISVTLDNEYNFDQYFQVSYSHAEVTVSLKTAIPEKVFKENSYITLTITASVNDHDSIRSQAIMNIELTREEKGLDEEDVTKYIVAISILVIFIVLLVAAAVLFYYLRLRNLKYKKMTEEEYIESNGNGRVKFDKSAMSHSVESKPKRSSAIEERRPTGFVFKPNVDPDEESRESTTDPPEILTKERKKSVAFDNTVEKLQIEPVNDDDTEKDTDENTD